MTAIPAHDRARILAARDQAGAARALLADIVARDPGNAAAWSDLGAVLYRLGDTSGAEQALRRAIALAPIVEAQRNLAILYRVQGRIGPARALAARAGDPLARFLAASTVPAILDDGADAESAESEYRAALAAAPAITVPDPVRAFGTLPHFHFAYWDRPVLDLHRASAAAYRRLCPSLTDAPAPTARSRPRNARPRVVFVSAHLHDHTVGRLFARLIAGLASRFEVIAALAPGRRDAMTRALAARVPVLDLPGDPARARGALAELAADIIVYPDLGLDPFTYFLAHARLAPRQITTWGHPVSPGLDSIDAFVGARGLSDGGAAADHGERLIHLPAPAFVFARPPVPPRQRTDYPLPAQGRLYLCPQNLIKLHPGFDPLIDGVLSADPTGHLVLVSGTGPSRVEALRSRFARTLGARAARVHVLPALTRPDFLGLLGMGDVMLDIPSFSGGNTTLEALAAGLPVVTWPRPTLRGGLSAALLRLAGLNDMVATSADDYVRRAVTWAEDGRAIRAAINAQAGGLFGRAQAVADFAAGLDRILSS